MPLEFDTINLLDGDARIELAKILSEHDRDILLHLHAHAPTTLNVANIDNYFDYPKTIPVVYRKKRLIEAVIIGIPIEHFYEDETFPDPEMGKRNTIYTAVILYNDPKVAMKLEAEYRNYLKCYNTIFESRHMRLDWVKGSGFEMVKVLDEWQIDGSPVAYCKFKINDEVKKNKQS